MNEQWYGVPFEPRSAPKMKECAALIRQHFATANGGALRFDGEFYRKMGGCVSDEMVEEIAIVGTPAECREKLARWQGVIDTPVLYAPVVGVTPERVLENSRRIVETFAQ